MIKESELWIKEASNFIMGWYIISVYQVLVLVTEILNGLTSHSSKDDCSSRFWFLHISLVWSWHDTLGICFNGLRHRNTTWKSCYCCSPSALTPYVCQYGYPPQLQHSYVFHNWNRVHLLLSPCLLSWILAWLWEQATKRSHWSALWRSLVKKYGVEEPLMVQMG